MGPGARQAVLAFGTHLKAGAGVAAAEAVLASNLAWQAGEARERQLYAMPRTEHATRFRRVALLHRYLQQKCPCRQARQYSRRELVLEARSIGLKRIYRGSGVEKRAGGVQQAKQFRRTAREQRASEEAIAPGVQQQRARSSALGREVRARARASPAALARGVNAKAQRGAQRNCALYAPRARHVSAQRLPKEVYPAEAFMPLLAPAYAQRWRRALSTPRRCRL